MRNIAFSQVLYLLKNGNKVAREGWHGKGMYLCYEIPDKRSEMSIPYIYIGCPKGTLTYCGERTKDFEKIPWFPSQADILAEDWYIVD